VHCTDPFNPKLKNFVEKIQLPLTGLGDVYLLLPGLGDVYPNNDRAAEKNGKSGARERTKLSVAQAS
jgi:hypothetical protein